MADLGEHSRHLAAYAAWANTRLFDAAGMLPDEAYRRDVGLYFRSLAGTLNHLLVTDRIWLHRLTGDGPSSARLDTTVHDDLAELRIARIAEDMRLARVIGALDAAALDADLTYANMRGDRFAQPLWQVLAHLFNHQAHHRGHAHAALTCLGVAEPPSLDLIAFQRRPIP